MASFTTLPPEIHFKIASLLSPGTLRNVSRVCRKGLVNDVYTWELYKTAVAELLPTVDYLGIGRDEDNPFGNDGFKTAMARRFFSKATVGSVERLLRARLSAEEYKRLSSRLNISCERNGGTSGKTEKDVGAPKWPMSSFLLSMILACISQRYIKLDILRVCALEVVDPFCLEREELKAGVVLLVGQERIRLESRWSVVGHKVWASLIAHQNVSAARILVQEFGLPVDMRILPDFPITPYTTLKDTEGLDLWTPLMVCCLLGKINLVRYLLESGADADAVTNIPAMTNLYPDTPNLTPLLLAIHSPVPCGNAEKNRIQQSPEQVIRTLSSKAEAIRMLISHASTSIDAPQQDLFPLEACFKSRPRDLLDHRYTNTILSTVLDLGASPALVWPETDTVSPLHFPIHNITNQESHPMLTSKLRCRRSYFKMLLQSGAFANGRDRNGNTPLMNAVGEATISKHGKNSEVAAHFVQIVEILVANGADPEARNRSNGPSPVMIAAIAGRRDLLEAMLGKGELVERWLTDGDWWESKCPGVKRWSRNLDFRRFGARRIG